LCGDEEMDEATSEQKLKHVSRSSGVDEWLDDQRRLHDDDDDDDDDDTWHWLTGVDIVDVHVAAAEAGVDKSPTVVKRVTAHVIAHLPLRPHPSLHGNVIGRLLVIPDDAALVIGGWDELTGGQ